MTSQAQKKVFPIHEQASSTKQSINWLESANRAINQADPRLGERGAVFVGERLSALLLARIPTNIGRMLLALLPGGAAQDLGSLSRHAESDPDRSIGYVHFVEAARYAVGNRLGDRVIRAEVSEEESENERRIADGFLWAIGGDLPAEIKAELLRELPSELRSRMNLQSAHSAEQRVA